MEFLTQFTAYPVLLAALLAASAWIWEDGAVVSGALLAVDGMLSVPFAVVAVFVGIMSSDIALYYLGRLAHRWRGLRGWIMLKPHFRHMSRGFRSQTLYHILVIRFIPGLRTLGFTLCGLWKVSLVKFLAAMGAAGVLWVGIVFTGVYQLGSLAIFEQSGWKWSLMAVAFLLLAVNHFWSFYRLKGAAT